MFSRTLLAVSLLGLTACASQRAVRAPDGSPYTVEIYFDRNSELVNRDQVAQVVGFMEPDLHSILLAAGYKLVMSSNPETFVPGPNRFLLIVKVVDYKPGSKAARMLVGFGAGALVLDTAPAVSRAGAAAAPGHRECRLGARLELRRAEDQSADFTRRERGAFGPVKCA
ncbi:MAG: DUF4410 domain-containing protein [Archangium sp.]|nr:DUF4410 domain-containing protein [Archangium sp.]